MKFSSSTLLGFLLLSFIAGNQIPTRPASGAIGIKVQANLLTAKDEFVNPFPKLNLNSAMFKAADLHKQ